MYEKVLAIRPQVLSKSPKVHVYKNITAPIVEHWSHELLPKSIDFFSLMHYGRSKGEKSISCTMMVYI